MVIYTLYQFIQYKAAERLGFGEIILSRLKVHMYGKSKMSIDCIRKIGHTKMIS